MSFLRHVAVTIVIMFIGVSAAEIADSTITPTLTIAPSPYVSMQSQNVLLQDGTVHFSGEFLVLGKGIFGHFDMVLYNAANEIITVFKSEDAAYRRDRGSKVKNISLSSEASGECTSVVVSFHEIRVDPDSGACLEGDEK